MGAAQPHVYAKDIATLDYPLLPLAKQQRIVAKLDSIFAEIDKTTNSLENRLTQLVALRNKCLANAFPTSKQRQDKHASQMWKFVKLGTICDFQNGFGFKSSFFKNNGLPDFENIKYSTR